MNAVKPVENIEISPVKDEVAPSHKLQDHGRE